MKGFCQHCGRELSDDEPFCPDCGSPAGSQTPAYSAPPKKSTNTWIIVIAVIAAIAILAIAIAPMLFQTSDTYRITITVDEFSVTLTDLEQYEGAATKGDVTLVLSFSSGPSIDEKSLTLYKQYQVNSGAKAPTVDNKVTFNHTGDPNDLKYTAFFYLQRGPDAKDMIDLYSVDKTKVTGDSAYFGCTGISFNNTDITDGTVILEGDSDPIGYVKLSLTSVKI